ncbi:ABC transporter ATP-binding protein [Microbulbifer flavimaris]|uniref:ABC transporter ATP-binding protein n=1 Tax=Microbulbifer flavimaris TaxID=1781068 RepID=A0ABX4I235_9GAMM|nr:MULTISPECIES: ABC transporter ATP-binding protein [Microbulbifer]KUJ83457.1 macrolide ABC transporter ATP-binding protein [Microbulbifer sp. ZGT114]PCO05614.1 ABC transporter ATP-binding protein [Microbulbifer flavimaris]
MITIKNLRREYGDGDARVVALADVSLQIEKNEFVAIMGSSGSGKSTLMNILGCLDQQSAGQYWLDGREVGSFDDDTLSAIRNRHIGFIFQTFHLLPRLTAQQNVMLPLRYSNLDESSARDRAAEMLARVGLGHRLTHRPFEMSGGQRQRVAIARALINRPKVIFADEPTGNLDSKTSEEILDLLRQLHGQGQTIVMVTHEPEIAAHAQRIIRMSDGKVVEDSSCHA